MLSHVKETDEAVPYRSGDFMYYTRTVKVRTESLTHYSPTRHPSQPPARSLARSVTRSRTHALRH